MYWFTLALIRNLGTIPAAKLKVSVIFSFVNCNFLKSREHSAQHIELKLIK